MTWPLNLVGAAGDGPGAAAAGRKTVDLEGLAFAQGSHLNTNKNTSLPPGSTRTTDKVIVICFEVSQVGLAYEPRYCVRLRLFTVWMMFSECCSAAARRCAEHTLPCRQLQARCLHMIAWWRQDTAMHNPSKEYQDVTIWI